LNETIFFSISWAANDRYLIDLDAELFRPFDKALHSLLETALVDYSFVVTVELHEVIFVFVLQHLPMNLIEQIDLLSEIAIQV
jgi:hypothetical protein